MILLPERAARPQTVLADPVPHGGRGLVPGWLRRAVPDAQDLAVQAVEDVAIAAGAAIGALDSVVRRDAPWAGAWRQRLALAAAAESARQAGRVEDEAALRDALLLTKAGDDVGPAGRLLTAWRLLVTRPAGALLTAESLAVVLEAFGRAADGEAVSDLAAELGRPGAGGGLFSTLTGAAMAVERLGFGHDLGAFVADALLAQRLGWRHAVPLPGGEAARGLRRARRRHKSAVAFAAAAIETEPDPTKDRLAALAGAALRAIDLSADLERRAEKLLAIAPKLRARGADLVVERLLSGDAMVASDPVGGMSDRALRRLFDRLVELGAVRELTGRPAFRIYGL